MRISMLIGLAALLLSACVYVGGPYRPPPDDEARLLYEIEVTAPGTRSQGWRGRLFDRDGALVPLRDGQRAETPAGTFVGVRCQHLWSTCGAVHEDMLRWMQRHEHNIQMGRDRWVYRLYARGYYADRLEGELMREGRAVRDGARVMTPMGPYRWIEGRERMRGRHGWFHESWR
jgi:hypothetical protein